MVQINKSSSDLTAFVSLHKLSISSQPTVPQDPSSGVM